MRRFGGRGVAERSLLGIDVGTTSVKAALVSVEGALLSGFGQSFPTQRWSGGIAEQDPRDWTRLTDAALEQLSAGTVEVAALGLCSQVNTHVFVDAAGNPLLPAILWQDGRARAEAAELDAQVSAEQKNRWWGTPMPIDASHALPRMLWVSRHHPDLWERTAHVLLPKDFVLMHLTGEATTDPLSNVGMVDNALAYIDELLALVPGARDKMAPLRGPTEIAGRIRRGSPFAGLPVVSGAMDAWAGLVGAGAAAPDSAMYLSGTSEIAWGSPPPA